MGTPPELDDEELERLGAWARLELGAQPPLTAALTAGGRSNLTFRVVDADGRRWALRRPPHGQRQPSAHDVLREHRIIEALHGTTEVPVPAPFGGCTDEEILGAPFMVMGWVDGTILRGRRDSSEVSETVRAVAATSLLTAFVAIHAVDIDAIALGDLAPREGYLARQLDRWFASYERVAERPLPAVMSVREWLWTNLPDAGETTLVHGDFRLDNAVLGNDGQVLAVLDWEIATLGDPIADLALTVAYWAGEGDEAVGPTAVAGFPTCEEVVTRYSELSGREVHSFAWYMAFAYWKLACIAEGVSARYASGGGGGDRSRLDAIAAETTRFTAKAAVWVEQGS